MKLFVRLSIFCFGFFVFSDLAQEQQIQNTSTNENSAMLPVRHFSVDANVFITTFRGTPGLQTNDATSAFKSFFNTSGVDWESPHGKSIFYNNRLGVLFVRATESDLDKIFKVLNSVAPQIHIKARFLEVPETERGSLSLVEIITNGAASLRASSWQSVGNITNARTVATASPGWACILTRAKLLEAIKTLQSHYHKDFEALAEPEVTTTSGRQTQIRATQIVNTNANHVRSFEISGPASTGFEPATGLVKTGPVLDVIPNVLSDGYTINLVVMPSGELPEFRVRQITANVNLWDGQTVVLCGLPEKEIADGKEVANKSKASDNELVVLITATIVDPAGNPIHADKEMPFAQKGIPPQPPQAK